MEKIPAYNQKSPTEGEGWMKVASSEKKFKRLHVPIGGGAEKYLKNYKKERKRSIENM